MKRLTASEQVTAKAKALMEEKDITFPQALRKVLASDSELRERYDVERNPQFHISVPEPRAQMSESRIAKAQRLMREERLLFGEAFIKAGLSL